MGEMADSLSASDVGSVVDPRSNLEDNEGWDGYGWYKSPVGCVDSDGDSDPTCSNESSYRTNAYVRRYNGGNFSQSLIVYDALGGAVRPYLVRSGFLMDSTNGWDTLGGPLSTIGMPIENERTTSFGSEQYFQWGKLQWDGTDVTVQMYPGTALSSGGPITGQSVGPGVFAPDGYRTRHYWKRGISYRFVEAWQKNGGATSLGEPVSDRGANHGVHPWDGTRLYIQNFDGGSLGASAIIYDPRSDAYASVLSGNQAGNIPSEGWHQAYVVRTAFWAWYRYNDGISRLGAPIEDEKAYGSGGAKQQFLCGWLEWTGSSVVVHETSSDQTAGCGIISAPARLQQSSCYGPATSSGSEKEYSTGGGGLGGSLTGGEMTISCNVGATDIHVSITGPIANGLQSSVSGSTIYLGYGSNSDGWGGYVTGKPKLTWIGDYHDDGSVRTYSMILGKDVQEMNFFLYNPSTSQMSYLDLSAWDVTGDCGISNGLITSYLDDQPDTLQGPCTTIGYTTCLSSTAYGICKFDAGSGVTYWDSNDCGYGMQCQSGSCVVSSSCSAGQYACASATSNLICQSGQWQEYNCASDSECLDEYGFCTVKQSCQSGAYKCTSMSSNAICIDGEWLFFNCASDSECLEQNGFCSVKPDTCTVGETRCLEDGTVATCVDDGGSSLPYMSSASCAEGYSCDASAGSCQLAQSLALPGPMNSINCRDLNSTFLVEFTGPVMDGLWGTVSGQNIYIEYGSNSDGWSAYTPSSTSKPYVEWVGDTVVNGYQSAYQLELKGDVDEINFFLYSPDSSEQEWFNLDWGIWTVTGDCYQSGTLIRHDALPAPTGTITCTEEGSNMRYAFDGPMQELLVGGSADGPLEVQYGSNSDSWSVPTSGKPTAEWLGTDHLEFVLPLSANGLNFYLHGSGAGAWFDLVDADWDGDSWTVQGDCSLSGSIIVH